MVLRNRTASKSIAAALTAMLSIAMLEGCGTPNLSVVPLNDSSAQSAADAKRAAAAAAERALTSASSSTSDSSASAVSTASTASSVSSTSSSSVSATQASTSSTSSASASGTITAKEAGTVVILATGGTIAGIGDEGKATEYDSGMLTADQLVSAVPEIKDVAPIEAVQVCNQNSDDISSETWLQLAKTINELANNPNIAGFVITHGTDTLEETAYFLNLTVKTDKPVVLTGSMRPATSLSADGPMNLYESVCVAASQKAAGKGVLAVFSDCIYTARSVTKTSTYRVDAIAAGEAGAIGVVRDGEVLIYEEPATKHTTASEFDVSKLTSLPKVSIVYFSVDANPELLSYAAEHSDGLVIAGAGAGEFSEGFIKVIEGLTKPVVISSHIDDGIITQGAVLCKNTVAANNLPPQKAAILLRLALASGNASNEKLIELYKTY